MRTRQGQQCGSYLSRRGPGLSAALALLAAMILLLPSCAGGMASAPDTVAPAAHRVVLPADDAAHPPFNTEWWYYNGRFETAPGEQYAFHAVVFDLRFPGLQRRNVFQVAVTDLRDGSYVTDQRSVNVPATQARGAKAGAGYAYAIGDWMAAGNGGKDRLAATAGDYAFDLKLDATKKAALHGGTGWLDLNPGEGTFYYSRTRMNLTGGLTQQGRMVPITGEAWFDHQWGDFRPQSMGWDWFAIQLDDGRDVMVSHLRYDKGLPAVAYGSLVDQNGTVQPLLGTDFQVEATGSWTSPASGATYPLGWALRIPSLGLDVAIAPVTEAAEFNAIPTTLNYYWEGPVAVRGSQAGKGFVEMAGYAPTRFMNR